MRTALVLGGTGQIGRAAAATLEASGWDVALAARNEAGLPFRFVRVDRENDDDLAAAIGDGVDLLLDVVAFAPRHAEQLIALGDRIGAAIVVSSASVYCDVDGRTLDEATGESDFPRVPVPIPETNPTVEPGDATYSTRKAAIEHALLESGLTTTVVRPCAIHGPGSRLAREWHFVKRVLDGRKQVLLAYGGESRFHTSSVANLAELIRLAADRPADRVLNCGDPEPPTTREIALACAGALGHEWEEVLLAGPPVDGVLGDNPWCVPRPFVVAMEAAERELGYAPVTTYADAVRETCEWLAEDGGASIDPERTHYLGPFDYDAEDAYLAPQ